MESRSYMFSTAKKRSTLLKSQPIKFPREDENAPRVKIYQKECPDSYGTFRQCMKDNGNNENLCYPLKQKLEECASVAFRKANSEKDYSY